MSGTTSEQRAAVNNGLGDNSKEMILYVEDDFLRPYGNILDSKGNIFFTLPATAVKCDAYSWLAINIVRVVAITTGVFIQGLCWAPHGPYSCYFFVFLAYLYLAYSIFYLVCAYSPCRFAIPVRHRIRNNWFDLWFLKIYYMSGIILCLCFDVFPFSFVHFAIYWYWATYTLAVLHIIRLIIAIFMVRLVLKLKIDPEQFVMEKVDPCKLE